MAELAVLGPKTYSYLTNDDDEIKETKDIKTGS